MHDEYYDNLHDDELLSLLTKCQLEEMKLNQQLSSTENLDLLIGMIKKYGMSNEIIDIMKFDPNLTEYLQYELTEQNKDLILNKLEATSEGFWKDFMRGGPITALVGMYLESTARLTRILTQEKARITPHVNNIDPIKYVCIKSFYLDNQPCFKERLPALHQIAADLNKIASTTDITKIDITDLIKQLRLCGYVVKDDQGKVLDGGDLSATSSVIMLAPGLMAQGLGVLHSTGQLHGLGNQLKSIFTSISSKVSGILGTAKSVSLESQAKNITYFFTDKGIANAATMNIAIAKNAVTGATTGSRLLTVMSALKNSSLFKFFAVAQPIEFVVAASLELVAVNIFSYPIGARGWKPVDALPAINDCLRLFADLSTIKQIEAKLEKVAQQNATIDEAHQKMAKRNMMFIKSCVEVYCHQTSALGRGVVKMAQGVKFLSDKTK